MINKPTYTSEDVRRYLEGKLSPAEMHALEKAALEDPFLADALEGMQAYGNPDQFSKDVDHLKDRLKKRVDRDATPIVATKLWVKIAAVLLVILTGVAIIIFIGEKNTAEDSQLARTENVELNDVTSDTARPSRDSAAASVMKEEVTDAIQSQSSPAGRAARTPAPPANPSRQRKVEETDRSRPLGEAEKPAADRGDGAKIEPLPEAPAARSRVETDQPAASKDDAAKEKPAAVTEAAMETPPSDTAFAEVVIIGSGATKNRVAAGSKEAAVARKSRNVLPATGWDEFEKYLNESFDLNSSDSTLSGEERLTFSIDENGTPESIKILKSLSPAHDREAIRVLREGPAWKVPQGAAKNVTLKLIF